MKLFSLEVVGTGYLLWEGRYDMKVENFVRERGRHNMKIEKLVRERGS